MLAHGITLPSEFVEYHRISPMRIPTYFITFETKYADASLSFYYPTSAVCIEELRNSLGYYTRAGSKLIFLSGFFFVFEKSCLTFLPC